MFLKVFYPIFNHVIRDVNSHSLFTKLSHSHRNRTRILRSRRIRIAFAFEDECEFISLTLEDANGRFKIELVRLGVLGEGIVGAPIRDVFSIGKMPSTGMEYG